MREGTAGNAPCALRHRIINEQEDRMTEYRMTDIHMHIIPGVDDGSYTLNMSKTLLMLAKLQGVQKVFATPHSLAFAYQPDLIRKNFQALQTESAGMIQLFLACEVRCELHSIQKTLDLLRTGVLPSMNGTKCVLTEFSTTIQPNDALDITELLLADGWIPIIAHVERYPALFERDWIDRIVGQGGLLQVNAYSLDDETDEGIVARARKLLADEKISFLGSDAHRLDFRPPSVEKGLQYVYTHCGKDYADDVAFRNAKIWLDC